MKLFMIHYENYGGAYDELLVAESKEDAEIKARKKDDQCYFYGVSELTEVDGYTITISK